MEEMNWGAVVRALLAQEQRTAGYLARQEIERLLSPIRNDATRLEPFGFKVYSQADEDGILEEIFSRLGITAGTFCEIGVENGLECNSLWLLHKGWRGAWIEGNPNQQAPITKTFCRLIEEQTLKVGIGFVTRDNINSILERLGLHSDALDFLSIDIDGNDIYIFESLDILPKVICIEYNGKWPSSVPRQQVYQTSRPWKGTDYMGSNLLALNNVAVAKGYRLVSTNLTGTNAFFIREDLAEAGKWPEPDPRILGHPARYWLIWDHYAHIGHPPDFGDFVPLKRERERERESNSPVPCRFSQRMRRSTPKCMCQGHMFSCGPFLFLQRVVVSISLLFHQHNERWAMNRPAIEWVAFAFFLFPPPERPRLFLWTQGPLCMKMFPSFFFSTPSPSSPNASRRNVTVFEEKAARSASPQLPRFPSKKDFL
jgi:hypothetical protein